jgi:hypothetical protein
MHFGNNDLAGFGRVSYHITPFEKFIRKATISLEGTQYGAPGNQNYQRVKTGLDIYFRNKKANSSLTQKVFGYYFAASSLYQIEHRTKSRNELIFAIWIPVGTATVNQSFQCAG